MVSSLINDTRSKYSKSVHVTHMGRSPRKTNLNQIVQISSSYRRNQSFNIWC